MRKADPYDTLVALITFPVDITLLNQSVDSNGKGSCRDSKVFSGISHRACVVGSDCRKGVHLCDGQVLEVTCLKRFLFCQNNIFKDPDQGL